MAGKKGRVPKYGPTQLWAGRLPIDLIEKVDRFSNEWTAKLGLPGIKTTRTDVVRMAVTLLTEEGVDAFLKRMKQRALKMILLAENKGETK